ncbi:hypothetical protein RA280_39120 [Cupriavidus sp. CV2]|nr:hypothetical protein [Cupriavidus sp. CV2]MDW3687646.1 hypothetical protein [Cupriavidus sp. CV2]
MALAQALVAQARVTLLGFESLGGGKLFSAAAFQPGAAAGLR